MFKKIIKNPNAHVSKWKIINYAALEDDERYRIDNEYLLLNHE